MNIAIISEWIQKTELNKLKLWFDDRQASVDKMLWNPSNDDLEPAKLKFIHDFWHNLSEQKWNKIDTLDLSPAWGHLMVLDIKNSGEDFIYRVYGSEISRHSGFDMTGKSVSEIKTTERIPKFFQGCYQAVVAKKQPLLTIHTPPLIVSVTSWTRYTLPFFDDSGNVNLLLVGNIPGDYRHS